MFKLYASTTPKKLQTKNTVERSHVFNLKINFNLVHIGIAKVSFLSNVYRRSSSLGLPGED